MPGAFQPPAERIQQADLRRQQRNAQQQHADIAQKNHHRGKQTALAGDVRLLRLQDVKGQRDVKRIRRADQPNENRPDTRASPRSNGRAANTPMTSDGVEREKIRRQRDQKIGLGNDHMAAGGGDFHFLDLRRRTATSTARGSVRGRRHKSTSAWAASEKITTQQAAPASSGTQVVSALPHGAQHQPQSPRRAGANRQQQRRR